jgi:hypothetical protein
MRFVLTRGRNVMFRHGPGCSEGPVSRTRGWWSGNKTLAADSDRGSERNDSCGPFCDTSKIRTELVECIRRAIAEGRYETPEKWEAALELLYQRLQRA